MNKKLLTLLLFPIAAWAVYQPDDNRISTLNSTTNALASAAVFTGTGEDVSRYNSVVVAVKTDQNGTYTVQFSNDNTNWDSTLTRYYRTTQIEPPHRFTITRNYCRVTFSNSTTSAQTYMRLQTAFGEKSDLNAPMDATLSQDYDATVVRPTDFHTEAALGRRQGCTTWNKFGYNLDSDTGTEIIASWGGTYQFGTTGETIRVVSTSIDDATGSNGVQSVVVYGVDTNWVTQTVVYPMTGTNPVVSAEYWIGINRVASYLAGTNRTNVGAINVTASGTGYQMAQMPAGIGVTQQLIYFVPVDHQFLVQWIHLNALKVSGATKPEITFLGQVYSAVNNTIQEVYRGKMDTDKQNDIDVRTPIPFSIGEKSIIYFTATSDVNDASVSGRFSGELFRDVDQ